MKQLKWNQLRDHWNFETTAKWKSKKEINSSEWRNWSAKEYRANKDGADPLFASFRTSENKTNTFQQRKQKRIKRWRKEANHINFKELKQASKNVSCSVVYCFLT